MGPRVLVLHPPLTVARDFIDYPYASDLGAVQLAAVLGDRAELVDASALPGAGMTTREDGRFHLGASVPDVLAAAGDAWDLVVIAYTPFHRPPHRDDVLGEVLAGLKAARPGAPIVLADLYQSGQHYVQVDPTAAHGSYPEIDAWVRYEGETTVPAMIEAFLEHGTRPSGTHDGARPDLAALPFRGERRASGAARRGRQAARSRGDRSRRRAGPPCGRGPDDSLDDRPAGRNRG